MNQPFDRRDFMRNLGIGAAAVPFALGLPSLGASPRRAARKQRLIVMFSPNGVVPWNFWPKKMGGDFDLPESVTPLAPFRKKAMFLKGVANKLRGDGDGHMRGIGCLLTGIELFPGNIQGGSDTPAGWSRGISIDQEITNVLQERPESRTRFGSLEYGVLVPNRANTWTRMSYAGPNKPLAPIDDPYQMFKKFYGHAQDREALTSVLDDVREDLKKISAKAGGEDRRRLEEQATFVREMEQALAEKRKDRNAPAPPKLPEGVRDDNDNMPKISRMQIDLMVHAFKADFNRVATLQYTNSVGGARMKWLGVNEGHHSISHKPDKDAKAQEHLTKINKWYAGELAHLLKRLEETPEPGADGSMLDHTLVVWTNELGKGNSHTRNDIPFLLVGGAPGFRMGRAIQYKQTPHNRLLLSLAHAFDHRLKEFGNPKFCEGGPLELG